MDTLKIAKHLSRVGFNETQAEGIAEVIADTVDERAATKADIADMKKDMATKADLKELKADLKWFVGVGLAFAAILVTIFHA